MTAFNTDDLAVVTGPLEVWGVPNSVHLEAGEVVKVLDNTESPGAEYVLGLSSGLAQYIDRTSLTPLPQWGDLIDPEYIHDYVWDEDYA